MYTLLLKLAGPLQSWGSDSRYETRRTERIPTKSGVIGMIGAALGIDRDDDLSELRTLDFGVRVDQPGTVIEDFHTAHNPVKDRSYITTRYYLSDAVFVAGISSPSQAFLEKIAWALKHPVYPLFLGRRSCPPALPLVIERDEKEVQELPLRQALVEVPFQGSKDRMKDASVTVSLFLTGDDGLFVRRVKDEPLTFSSCQREYAPRTISEFKVRIPVNEEESVHEHDPMEEL